VVSSEKFAKIYHEETLHVCFLWKVGQKQLNQQHNNFRFFFPKKPLPRGQGVPAIQFHVLQRKIAKDWLLFNMSETMAAYNNKAF
jgi:hypothetical protein